MSELYSSMYHAYCLAIQQMVEQRLERGLSSAEQAGIWNAGSLMMLEVVERDLVHSQDNAVLPAMLIANAEGFRDRFTAAHAKTSHLLTQHRVRAFVAGHYHQLRAAKTIYDLMLLAEQYPETRKRSS